MSKPSDYIQTIENAFSILNIINKNKKIGVTEISNLANLSKTTTFRILKTLEYLGIILQIDDDDTYSLGYELLNFQVGVDAHQNLIQNSIAPMKHFSSITGESINLSIKNGENVYVLHTEEGEKYNLQLTLSPIAELYCSSMGKIYLAHLSDQEIETYFNQPLESKTINTVVSFDAFLEEKKKILKNNIAYDNEEYEYGLSCIAKPIKINDKLVATISVSGPTTRLKFKGYHHLQEALANTREEIEKNLSSILN